MGFCLFVWVMEGGFCFHWVLLLLPLWLLLVCVSFLAVVGLILLLWWVLFGFLVGWLVEFCLFAFWGFDESCSFPIYADLVARRIKTKSKLPALTYCVC